MAACGRRACDARGPACVSRRAALGALIAGLAGGGPALALPALEAGQLTQLRLDLPEELHPLAGAVRVVRAAVATPAAFDPALPWRLLVVSATSDPGYQSSRALMNAYRAAATGAGWVVLAADPEPDVASKDDSPTLRFALALAAADAVCPSWREPGRARFAFAGFSGGAKHAGWVAALFRTQGARVAGIFLSGVNEDTVAPAARRLKVLDDDYRDTPVFLQAGATDGVATPAQHRDVRADLLGYGFRQVRLEVVEGGHRPDPAALPAALEWFAAHEPARR